MIQFSEDAISNIKTSLPVTIAEEMAEAARKGYCFLYQNHPGWVLVKDNLTLPIVKRYLDRVCQEEGFVPPPDPEPPLFTGGQCCDAPYNVKIVGTSATSTGRVPYQVDLVATGAILSLELVTGQPPDDDKAYWRFETQGCNATESSIEDIFAASINADIRVESVTVSRTDGLPDDCGDPPASTYPETPLPQPPDLVQDIDIVNNNGDTNTYNVTINPDLNGTIKFSPEINVNNVRVGIDLGGITVGGGDTNNYSGGGGGGGSSEYGGEPETQTEEEVAEQEEEGGADEDVEKLVAIKINITGIPVNAKIVDGRGAPDLIYAGWIEFKIEKHYFPRQYIDFHNQYYPAPEGATGYAVTFKRGYFGEIVKVVAK